MIKTDNLFLKKLNFSDMGLNSKGVKLLVQGLTNCKLLKHLNLSNNSIDDAGIPEILTLIDPSSKVRVKLTELDLSNNRLTSIGCSKLLT